MDSPTPPALECRRLVEDLRDPDAPLPGPCPPHAREPLATLADHLLTTAALVACLAHADPQRDLLRLAALTHDLAFPAELRAFEAATRVWRALLHDHGASLDRGQTPDLSGLDAPSRMLALAHLAASTRQPVARAADFERHPLAAAGFVDLVYGGAVKVKGYVFESVKLPEIRGASALLDHINQIDLPALWGVPPRTIPDRAIHAAQIKRYDRARAWFYERFEADALDAPECVLYASGGNILALAPAGCGERLAAAIERRYTDETQTAQSVGVWQRCSLLEVQYGLSPGALWLDHVEGQALFRSDDPAAQLVRQTFGIQRDVPAQDAQEIFLRRKGFGELVTSLTAKATRRRMSDRAVEGPARPLPFVEHVGLIRRCTSCDLRPAAETFVDDATDRREAFCAACLRKRTIGSAAKSRLPSADRAAYDWVRPWAAWLAEHLDTRVEETARDLDDISEHAKGFVGLIYADGNSVGEAVANLGSISAYRRFAQRMLRSNEQAVAHALGRFIQPATGRWPFEIITIGGDDVLLFVPATAALDLAASIASDFEAAMQGSGISLSVGVLIMPESTPIRFARDLVEQLLESAKQRSKHEGGGSTIDFLALKATTMIPNRVEGYRTVALRRDRRRSDQDQPEHTLRLTQRPYTLEQLRRFLDACRALKTARFPRSQLYQLRAIIQQGDMLRSAVDYRYFVERGKQRDRSGGYAQLDQQVQTLCEGQIWIPWRLRPPGRDPQTHHYDTPLLDLIELLPFVDVPEQQGGPA
ncbi:MAG TPA: hypothetical protein VFZ66_13020 [Herpetosiphonaceae bacterium]